jgi:hypothetical protein
VLRDIAIRGWRGLVSLDWAADGKGFFASSSSSKGVTLLHIDMQGNAQALWAQRGGSPTDGKSLAIFGSTIRSNVWMIENF